MYIQKRDFRMNDENQNKTYETNEVKNIYEEFDIVGKRPPSKPDKWHAVYQN